MSNISLILESLNSVKEDTNYPDTSKEVTRVYFPTESEGIDFCEDNKLDLGLLQYDSNDKYYYIEKSALPHTIPKYKYGKIPVGTRYEKNVYMNKFSDKQRTFFESIGAVVFSKGIYYVNFDMVAEYKKKHGLR